MASTRSKVPALPGRERSSSSKERAALRKCAFERRGYAPGEHGKDRRSKETSYGLSSVEAKDPRILRRSGAAFGTTSRKRRVRRALPGDLLLKRAASRQIVFGWGSHRPLAARQLVRTGFHGERAIVDIRASR